MPDGKPANHFAFDGQCKDKVIGKNHGYGCWRYNFFFSIKAYAHSVIQETHDAWKRLIEGKIPCKAPTHDIDV
jgi:inorganic pyrophosphatase